MLPWVGWPEYHDMLQRFIDMRSCGKLTLVKTINAGLQPILIETHNMPHTKTTWKTHKTKWESCTGCPLHKTRRRPVLLRGSIPADILFVGEAPGVSEDAIGIPFVGPAGRLLDHMVASAIESCGLIVRTAYTNLVACIPKTGGTIEEPNEERIQACSSRLREVFQLCQPRLCVCVGTLSKKWVTSLEIAEHVVHIVHPAAILRADVSQQQLLVQRVVVTLSEAVQDVFGGMENNV